MRTDFNPVHLQEVNKTLDELISSLQTKQEHHTEFKVKKSLWQRFLGLFKSNPFELPEDLYKVK